MSRASFAVFAVIAVCLGMVFWLSPSRNERLVQDLVECNACTDEWNDSVDRILKPAVAGTPFESKTQINKTPRQDSINLYILRGDLSEALQKRSSVAAVRGRCAFVGAPAVIVVDSGFVTKFLDARQPLSAFDPAASRQSQLNSLLTWILGHEVGHIVLGHRPVHVERNLLDEGHSNSFAASQKQESAADTYCVASVIGDAPRLLQLNRFLFALLNVEILQKVGPTPVGVGIHFDYNDRKIVQFIEEQSHPDWVLRCADLLKVIGEKTKNQPLVDEVTTFLEHLRKAPSGKIAPPTARDVVVRIKAANGAVLPNATISLFAERDSQTPRIAETDLSGKALFPSLDNTENWAGVAAHKPSQSAVTFNVLKDETNVEAKAEQLARFEGTVNGADGRPAPHLRCTLSLQLFPDPYRNDTIISRPIVQLTTAPDGTLTNDAMIPKATYALTCDDPRFSLRTDIPSIILQPADVRHWDFELIPK